MRSLAKLLRIVGTLLVLFDSFRDILFFSSVETCMEGIRSIQFTKVISNLNPAYHLVIDRNSANGIFRRILGARHTAIFTVNTNNYTLKDKFEPDETYFLITPHAVVPDDIAANLILFNLNFFNDSDVVANFLNLYEFIFNSPYSYIKLGDLEYCKKEYPTYNRIECSLDGLGSVIKTSHTDLRDRKVAKFILKMKALSKDLSTLDRKTHTKEQWLDQLIARVTDLLMEEGILRSRISLSEYPEAVPVLFPFKVFDNKENWWSIVAVARVGVSLKGVEGSVIECFFNKQLLRRFCNHGGEYIYTIILN